ncbi:hypothetical protein [Terriglobus aquaticus]|uniref:Uncharacterized protein n=1 Tax=Terriglobus aquaticus TaxID=940139 RepID=A0ABW9KJD1_9BACT|nr:hypothetical protein [Terriglobus aquaticus]
MTKAGGWTFPRLKSLLLCVALPLAAAVSASGQKGGSSGGGHPAPAPAPAPTPSPVRSPGNTGGVYGSSPYGSSPYAPYGINSPFFGGSDVTPQQASLYSRLQRQERQKRIVTDTNKLVALTSEYQHALQQGGQTPDTDRKLRDIEKLARNLRATLVQ